MKKCIAIGLICLLLISLGAPVCLGAAPPTFPVRDPSVQTIAAAVDIAMDELLGQSGKQTELNFAFSPQNYTGLQHFKDELSVAVHPLLTALFAADMAGRDYITVRTAYGTLTRSGVVQAYYFSVKLTAHNDTALEKELTRLTQCVKGLDKRAQVEWLASYLYHHIEYDAETLDTSGTYLALMAGRGVCMGYARSLLELCRRLDIPCISLVNDEHMWNAVYLDGSWLMLDVTWNIGLQEEIVADGHEYDAGEYRAAKYYYQNYNLNRGKVIALAYTDLTDEWYQTAVRYCLGGGYFKGVSATTFAPNDSISRGMFVTVLGRLAGAEEQASAFRDVPRGQYFAGYIGWAAANGIVKGVGNNCFEPHRAVTREELCKIMDAYCSFDGIALVGTSTKEFADHAEISAWARKSVYLCRDAGLVQGKGKNRFDPAGTATRAETAVILYNLKKLTK